MTFPTDYFWILAYHLKTSSYFSFNSFVKLFNMLPLPPYNKCLINKTMNRRRTNLSLGISVPGTTYAFISLLRIHLLVTISNNHASDKLHWLCKAADWYPYSLTFFHILFKYIRLSEISNRCVWHLLHHPDLQVQ